MSSVKNFTKLPKMNNLVCTENLSQPYCHKASAALRGKISIVNSGVSVRA